MTVVVNAVTSRGLGSLGVGTALVRALHEARPEARLLVRAPAEWRGRISDKNASFHRSNLPRKLLCDQFIVPAISRRSDISAVLTLGDTGSFKTWARQLVFVQQAWLAMAPEEALIDVPQRFRARIHAMGLYFKLGMHGAEGYIVQSEWMRNAMISRWRLSGGDVHVVRHGPVGPVLSLDDLALRAAVRREGILAFVPSNAAPHKNLSILPRIVATSHQAGLPLRAVVTADPSPQSDLARQTRTHRVEGHVDYVGTLSHAETMERMASSDVIVLPSVLESFGLAYIEAMMMGRPIVCADTPIAREVCGDAAVFADPFDESAWTKSIRLALADDRSVVERAEENRAILSQRGFDWSSAADRLWALLGSRG